MAKWVESTADYESDESVEIVRRLSVLEDPATEEEVTVPVADPESDDGSIEILDDTVLPKEQKRESAIDDSIDAKWKSWKDEEAFCGGGVCLSNQDVVFGSTALIILIVGVVLICCCISYLERKKIA